MLRHHIAHGVWPTSHAASDPQHKQRPTLLTLCLGANDSCLPNGAASQQAVPIEQYQQNMIDILTTLKGSDGKSTSDLHVIMIGPPQCDNYTWGLVSKQRHGLAEIPMTRDNTYTAKFNEAARSVAEKFKIPFIDMYSLTADWNHMLCDGLHYTSAGNYKLFNELKTTIDRAYPHLSASSLPLDSFPFLDITPTTLEGTQEFFRKADTNKQQAQA